jgi:predicted glutamine amidotransferase
MCGLVGWAGFLEHKHKLAMKDMLFLNSLRGKDSTGLTAVRRNREVVTRKLTVPGYEFIEYPIVDRTFSFGDQVWLGHGRFKTTGDVSRANAHPFEVLDKDNLIWLVGTHNGTLNNKWDIEQKLGGEKFDTDSEALFNWFAEAPDYRQAAAALKGAWSLVWWDATQDAIHFLRNEERPLVYAFTKDRKAMCWASEAWMIVNACRRNGVELEANANGIHCTSTVEHNLYTMKIPQARDQVLPELIREGGYTGAPVKNFRNGYTRATDWDWWNKSYDDDFEPEGSKKGAQTQEKGKTTPKTNASSVGGTNVVTLGYPPVGNGQMAGFQGKPISKEVFSILKKKGCSWCHSPDNPQVIYGFIDDNHLVCTRCVRDMHPKTGDCLRRYGEEPDEDFLDDDLPFDLTDKGKEVSQADTDEFKRLMSDSAKKAVG